MAAASHGAADGLLTSLIRLHPAAAGCAAPGSAHQRRTPAARARSIQTRVGRVWVVDSGRSSRRVPSPQTVVTSSPKSHRNERPSSSTANQGGTRVAPLGSPRALVRGPAGSARVGGPLASGQLSTCAFACFGRARTRSSSSQATPGRDEQPTERVRREGRRGRGGGGTGSAYVAGVGTRSERVAGGDDVVRAAAAATSKETRRHSARPLKDDHSRTHVWPVVVALAWPPRLSPLLGPLVATVSWPSAGWVLRLQQLVASSVMCHAPTSHSPADALVGWRRQDASHEARPDRTRVPAGTHRLRVG